MPRLLLLILVLAAGPLRAAEADDFAAVRRADQRRIVATIASDLAGLGKILSDDLVYTNADGHAQTKAQFVAAAAARRVKYLSVVPQDVTLQTIVPEAAVAMSGRSRLVAEVAGRPHEFTLRFVAVWRREAGEWRLLTYQSSQFAEVPTAAAK